MPRAAVHVHDGRKWSASFGLIDASQPRLASQVLILDVPLVYFEFAVGFHTGNLQQASINLQAPTNRAGRSQPGGWHEKSPELRVKVKRVKIVAQDSWYIAAQGGGVKIANSDSNIDCFLARRRDNSGFGGGAPQREYR